MAEDVAHTDGIVLVRPVLLERSRRLRLVSACQLLGSVPVSEFVSKSSNCVQGDFVTCETCAVYVF